MIIAEIEINTIFEFFKIEYLILFIFYSKNLECFFS
jgi:hypothetical protein